MSDNIWFLKDFPFATTFGSPTVRNPVAVPYKTCGEWRHRIRNWEVATDFTVGVTTPPPPPVSAQNGVMNNSGYTNEKDFVFSAGILEFDIFVDSDNFVRLWLFSTVHPEPPLINSSGDYYPWIWIFGACNGLRFNSDAAFGFPNSTAGNVGGISIPIYYESAPSGSTVSVSFFDFIPVEWWPYASRADGSPIWDAATGVQLQDPRN